MLAARHCRPGPVSRVLKPPVAWWPPPWTARPRTFDLFLTLLTLCPEPLQKRRCLCLAKCLLGADSSVLKLSEAVTVTCQGRWPQDLAAQRWLCGWWAGRRFAAPVPDPRSFSGGHLAPSILSTHQAGSVCRHPAMARPVELRTKACSAGVSAASSGAGRVGWQFLKCNPSLSSAQKPHVSGLGT